MNKIAVYYSIFSFADDVSSSMFWILCFAENLKFYMLNNLWKQVDIIVCTDSYTKMLIDDVIAQENIAALNSIQFEQHVKWRQFSRHRENYTGKIWRFYAFADNGYDIAIVGEVDFTLENTLCLLQESFKEDVILQLVQTKAFDKPAFMFQADYTNGPFNAGEIVVRSSKLNQDFKKAVKSFIDCLVENEVDFKFAIDEKLLLYIIERLDEFFPCQSCNVINCILCDTDHFFRLVNCTDVSKIQHLEKMMNNYEIRYFKRNSDHLLSGLCSDSTESQEFLMQLPLFKAYIRDSSHIQYELPYYKPKNCIFENLLFDNGQPVNEPLQSLKWRKNPDGTRITDPFEYTLNGKKILFRPFIENQPRNRSARMVLNRTTIDSIFSIMLSKHL